LGTAAVNWRAQKLLDYGSSTLDSLPPGKVCVGGTDNGRETEARSLTDDFTRQHPAQRKELERIRALWHVPWRTPTPTP
jgi:hypothetical protein